jgi:hypothetical protein
MGYADNRIGSFAPKAGWSIAFNTVAKIRLIDTEAVA